MIKIEMNANNETVEILPSKIKIPSSGLSENLQHVEQTCQFSVPYNAGLLSFLLRNNVINAVVKDDSNALFTGQITVDTSWTDNGEEGLIESFDLSISDNTRLFDKKTENEVALIHTNLSAVIQKICLDCGVEIESVANLPTTEVPAFVLDAGKSYLESLNTLLYEYGYAFGFNENGELKIFDIATEPTQLSLIGENELFAGVSLQKVKKTYDSVKITYANLVQRTDEQVYFEGNDLNSDNEIVPITIRPNQYYPYESDPVQEAREGQVFQTFEAGYAESYTLYSGEKKYRRTNKTQLVYTENHRIVEDWEGNLTINRTAFGARQASVRLFNQTSSDVNLYQLAIRADAYYRSENIFLALGSGSSPYESETEYIFAQSTAERFASMLSRFVMGGNLKISANLENQVYPGRAYVIDTGATALTTTAICISCNYDPENEKYEASFLTYGEASIDIHRRRERGICQKTYSYDQLKGEKGDQGEPGTAAKFVEIEADSGLVFKNGSPSQLPLKCIATGFTASAYQWYKDGTAIPGATSQTYNATDAGVYKVTANGYSDIATVISVSDGADGNDGTSPYACSVSNENFTVATGTDLKPLSVTTYSVKFTAYKGSSQLSAIAPSATIASGKFKVSTPTATGFEVAQSTNGTITFKTATSTAISENLSVNVTVTYDNGSSETKTITISASKTGAKGASSYSYVRYSANADGTDFTSTPSSETKYVGFYSGTSSTAPTDKASYTWTKFVGEDGANGTSLTSKGNWVSGTAYKVSEVVYYATNKTSYVCKKAHTSSSSILPTNTTYWTVLAAPGTNGQAATQYYMHFVYCDDISSGTNYSTTESRKYVGIYTDTTQADAATFSEANAKSGIVWSKAEGDKGDTGARGSVWYSGTGITGTSTTATVFSGSGVSSALVGDMYKNTSTNYTYRCTVAGKASTAKWVYTGNLTGAKGDKGDKGDTGGPGSRAPQYRGPGSAPTTDLIVGDWYLNTSDGKVYVRAASSWIAQSTTTPNQYHLDCINDMISLFGTTTNTTVKNNLKTICDAYVERLLVGTAFINKLSANQITFTEYVGSGKLSGWALNDINVALGKNPFNSSDPDLSFIIQSYKRANSSGQNPIFNKEFYLKKENNRFNLVTSGKILSDMGISSFNNCYLGGKLIRHTISGQAQKLNGWNAACVYYKNYFFIFWGKSGSGIIVQRSSNCSSFSTYTTLSSYTYLVYDAVVYKDYIYLATSNGVYKTNSATPTSLTLVTSTYKPYRLQIINDLLFFPHDTMFVYYDGSTLSTYSTSAKSNYISEFTDGIYFVSPTAEVASGQASASVIDVYFYNKNFAYLGAYGCLTKYYDSSGNKVSYSSIGVIGAAKGILYGYVDFNKIVLSYDAGANWYQKFSFTLQGTPRLFISGSLVVIKDETHYCYSFDGGETWAEVTGGSGSTYLPGNCFTFEDDNDFYVGIPYCKSGTALGIDFIRQHKVGTTSYLPIGAPKIIEDGAVWIE